MYTKIFQTALFWKARAVFFLFWVRKFKPKAMSQFYEVWGMEFPKAYDKIQTDLYKEIFLKDTEKACGWKPKEAPEAVTNGYKMLPDVCNRLI